LPKDTEELILSAGNDKLSKWTFEIASNTRVGFLGFFSYFCFMRRKYRFLCLLCICFWAGAGMAQTGKNADKPFSGMRRYDDRALPVFEQWQQELHKFPGVSASSQWKIYSELQDELGQIHYRAQQYFNGVALENGVVIIHTYMGSILSINGEIIPEFMIQGKALIEESQALKYALAEVPAVKYYWEEPGQNEVLRQISGVADTSYYPAAKVMYAPQALNYLNPHQLSYCFEIFASEPLVGKKIYISASTGQVLATEDLILHTDVPGKAATAYSGTKTMMTDSVSPGNYRLREASRGKGIETYNMQKGTNYGAAVDFTDADNYWNNVNTNKDEIATDAHWGAQKTYDFFDTLFGRNSFDNNGAKIRSYVHYSNNYSNAFWNGSYMTYGDGNGTSWKPLTSIDVCGHEIAHAVTTYSAGLVYSYESGALNESFSDIFGNGIERWARPGKFNWKMGEDFTTSGAGIRDMSNPNPYNNPRYYKGAKWYFGAGDNGGVHYNSGVQNYWFYLITDGIKGTNEKGDAFKIDTLGLIDASKIAYRNLTVYLTKNSQYADARTYSILAATDLFGNCSKHVIAVTNAWWVCGVGAKYDSGYVKADFIGDTVACSTVKSVRFSNLSTNSLTSKWYFGDGNTSTSFNATHTYGSYGSFSVKLVAKSCFKNRYDSITRTGYVKVDSTYDICNAVLMPAAGTDSAVKCFGFIYDDGGEGFYGALRQTNLKVSVPGATQIRFRFLVMDYENGYDSIVMFKNSINWSNKLGRFTGTTMPFGGTWQTFSGDAIWLRHYSDPMVEGKGFKIEFEGIRNPLTLTLGNDTTICMGDSLVLVPNVGGGYAADYRYSWSNGSSQSKLTVQPVALTQYWLTVKDACTRKQISDSIAVSVRPGLSVNLGKDTTICAGRSVTLKATATGGLSTAYAYTWNPAGASLPIRTVTPTSSTQYRVILSDGCSEIPDTAYQWVIVKPALDVKIAASDTLVCIGKSISLTASGSGGDTSKYNFAWSNGLGIGNTKNITLSDTGVYTVTLTDACTVVPAIAQVKLYTYPKLELSLNNDTLICRGSSVNLTALGKGGRGSNYSYTWTHGKSTAGIAETPATATWYKVAFSDACSPGVADSVYVTLMAPLDLSAVRDTILCDGQSLPVNLLHTGGKLTAHSINWIAGGVSGYSPVLSPSTGTQQYVAVLSDGCTAKNDTTQFSIQKLAPLSASMSITPAAICLGDSVTMLITVGGGKSLARTWTLDAAPIGYTKSRFQPLVSKSYQLDLTDGCSVPTSATAAVSISAAAAATLSATPTSVCVGGSSVLTYNSPDAAKFMWYFSNGDSLNGVANNVPKALIKAGKLTARVKVVTSNGCYAWFDLSDTLIAVAYPKAAFAANPAVTDIENPTITFSNTSSGASTYRWNFGDGSMQNTIQSPVYTFGDTGRYYVTLISSIAPSCADTAYGMVRVKDVYRLYMPLAFTPDANNLNDMFLPRGRGIQTFSMEVYNRWGEKVFESKDMNKGWTGIDANGISWPTGRYAVRVEIIDTEGFRHVEKATIELLR